MQADRPQRGFISFSGIISLVVLAVGIFLGFRLIPPYVSNYQLQDSIQNLTLIASYSPMGEQEILKAVVSRANSYGIDLPAKQVTVHKGSGSVVIVAQYTVPVDLLMYRVELHFAPSASNRQIAVTGSQ